MSRIRLIIILVSLSFHLSAQSLATEVETALAAARDSQQLEVLIELLAEMINAGDLIHDTMFDQSLERAHELEDAWSLAILYSDRSVYELNTGEIEKGLIHIDQAIEYAKVDNRTYLIADYYATKMTLMMVGGQTKESAELASSLAKEYHAAGDFYNEAITYQVLSSLSSGLGDYEMTMKYDSTAIALARQSGYIDVLVSVLCSGAENLNFLGYPERALVEAEEALAIAEKHGLEFEAGNALSARAVAHTELGNYDQALKDFADLEDWYGDQRYSWAMISKGILLQRVGRHDEARSLLLEAATMIKETSNDHLALKRCYQALRTVGLNTAKYDTVALYTKLLEMEQDSVQAEENMRNLLELEKKYKTEEKTEKIQRQKTELARQHNRLQVMIGGFVFALLAGGGFLLFSWKLKKRNAENEELIREKEVLIGEIHHRVKNNLQVISSLLQLQRRRLKPDDEKGRAALKESQNRVNSMGLIHQKLYQGTGVVMVNMPDYIENLGESLIDAYQLEEQVEVFCDVAEINLDVDVAIPLGLIVNELVTNSLKYAFPNGREGTIEISLHREHKQIRLEVSDNRTDTAIEMDQTAGASFETNLISLLTERLKGEFTALDGPGYGVAVSFPG